jgi:predicted ATPase
MSRQRGDEFPAGVWFLELAAVNDPAAVPDAVAAVLGTAQQPGKSVSESVAVASEGRVRLLVMDNCEHVLDAAGDLIDAVLTHSTTVRVLATSRKGLGVAQEQVQPVRSLETAAGIDSAAVSPFIERAQRVAPEFCMGDGDEAAAVSEICKRLDGIPLTTELAASRMASMTANEVRNRLDDRFRLLVGSRRGLERHHTLRHAVQWSYDLLSTAERSLLERCSVFAGGFDLESACAIVGFDDADEYVVLIFSMHWCANRCSSRTVRPRGLGSRCSRPSASSPRNNLCPVVRLMNFAARIPVTSLQKKPRCYEALARTGATMTTAEIVAHAYDQIDQARAELNGSVPTPRGRQQS